ncbi:uncharacterized protein LOC142336637 [Convolutriloba macropyga]|uniref:uncharacterized protein LOC142336637 n=1 Tax=Convolutriloba macropyga TaxID=536237 RepID=UPI003F520A0D
MSAVIVSASASSSSNNNNNNNNNNNHSQFTQNEHYGSRNLHSGVRPISKSSDYHFMNSFGQLVANEEPNYFQVVLKSPEYDEYLFDSHMELYDVTPLSPFDWPSVLEYSRSLNIPALFLIRSDIGIDKSVKLLRKMNNLFFILYIPVSLSSRCSYLKSTNRNYYADNLWDNNLPTSSQARRYKQMQLKLLPFLEEYDVETLQFTDIAHFEKYYKLLKLFNHKWALQRARASLSCLEQFSSISGASSNPANCDIVNASTALDQPVTIEIQRDANSIGGPDNEVSEVVNGRHLGLSCSSSSSRGAMDSRGCYSGHHRTGGGGLFHSAGLTVGIGTGGGGGGGGGVNSHSISSSDDLLTTDSALEEHERSSPTDMTKTLSDHEKEPLTPSGAEEDEKRPESTQEEEVEQEEYAQVEYEPKVHLHLDHTDHEDKLEKSTSDDSQLHSFA